MSEEIINIIHNGPEALSRHADKWSAISYPLLIGNTWHLQRFITEPEFLNILKCNLAESASAGFQFNCYDIFNDKTLVITGICTTFQIY